MKEKAKEKKPGSRQDNGKGSESARIPVAKTYKMYIGGQFPRTESGRYLPVKLKDGRVINICRASRKDFRNAVVAARSAFPGWAGRSAFNRSQIIYRIAEVMEGRKAQLVADLLQAGIPDSDAYHRVEKAIDIAVYYAGCCDKYQQIFGTVNPVASAHFNFSVPEPVGVVGVICPKTGDILTLMSLLMPVITGANAAVVLVPPVLAASAMNLAEVLETSDVPQGTVNILTGLSSELLFQFGSHLDVNAVVYAGDQQEEIRELEKLAASHVLRVVKRTREAAEEQHPYQIMDTQEIKTTWHPVGK
jgi:acyl-CoA reductase-like NAD-dependent aldehyde dehydrogenase